MSAVSAVVLALCFLGIYMPAPSLATSSGNNDFSRCLLPDVPSQLVLTPGSPSFKPVLVSSIRNARFVTPATASPPLCIVTPTNASHVQAAVRCGRAHGVRLRVRSGGHDTEGISSRSQRPEVFAIVDLANLHNVHVNPQEATAWVDSGATLGELYYAVAKAAPGLGFPAGVCPTVGVGGHLSGGGQGLMMRKYGLAADNIVDATIVDANGNFLSDKKAMGDDLFWAIRGGGGGGSFGVVLSFKVRLAPVPPTVTFFSITRSMDQGAVEAVTKWQTVAPALPDDLTVRVNVQQRQANFQSLYLGNCSAVVGTLRDRLPELGVTRADCREMSWLQYAEYIYFGDAINSTPLDVLLLNRTLTLGRFYKNKSDYVNKALTKDEWEKIFTWPSGGAVEGQLVLEPHGGRMGSIADADTPFPHRGGVLYNIQYVESWNGNSSTPSWVNTLYDFMEPLVSKNPRAAYANYRDLDIGVNKQVHVGGVSSYESGKVWGERYFAGNFKRLAMIKGRVDAGDYFRNEQSVPPLHL